MEPEISMQMMTCAADNTVAADNDAADNDAALPDASA
jgi:hypothetical protein